MVAGDSTPESNNSNQTTTCTLYYFEGIPLVFCN